MTKARNNSRSPAVLPWADHRQPLLLGHRGAPLAARENTAAALDGAVTAGLDGIETDLQRTRDGALVIHHDPLFRDGRIIALTSREDALLADPDLLDFEGLKGFMERHPQALLNLEVKTSAPMGDARAEETAAALQAWPAQLLQRTWISSFDPLLLLKLSEEGAPVPLAYLVSELSALQLLPVLPVAAVHPHHRLVTAELVKDWHGQELAVFSWTVNDAALAVRLLDAGVDGLIGDDPAVLLRAAGR